MQQRFSPEQIGIQASSALAWGLVEMGVYAAALYITNIQTSLRTLDLVAYAGYKYVGVIVSVLLSLALHRTGYYVGLAYCSLALAFFLVRSLKIPILPEGQPRGQQYYGGEGGGQGAGSRRRRYFLLFVAAAQPAISWWLSFHLVGYSAAGAAASHVDGV